MAKALSLFAGRQPNTYNSISIHQSKTVNSEITGNNRPGSILNSRRARRNRLPRLEPEAVLLSEVFGSCFWFWFWSARSCSSSSSMCRHSVDDTKSQILTRFDLPHTTSSIHHRFDPYRHLGSFSSSASKRHIHPCQVFVSRSPLLASLFLVVTTRSVVCR